MSKTIYDEALEYLSMLVRFANARECSYEVVATRWEVERIIKIIEQAQKQEKLLELYEKLATHRYIVIHNLLDDIIHLKEGANKSLAVDIDYILSDLDDYENGDIKITNEILKLKELEK